MKFGGVTPREAEIFRFPPGIVHVLQPSREIRDQRRAKGLIQFRGAVRRPAVKLIRTQSMPPSIKA